MKRLNTENYVIMMMVENGKKKKKIKIIIIIIAIAIILLLIMSILIGVLLIFDDEDETITIEELSDDFENEVWKYQSDRKSKYKDGDVVTLKDTVSYIELINTSYGPLTIIHLNDDFDNPGVYYTYVTIQFLGDFTQDYIVGKTYSIPIHFHKYFFDDKEYIFADEIIPHLILGQQTYRTFDYSRLPLEYVSNPSNSFEIEIGFQMKEYFNFDLLTSTLSQNTEYWFEVGDYIEIDNLDPMAPGLSEKGRFKINDIDGNGRLSLNDKIILLGIQKPTDRYHIETYLFHIDGIIQCDILMVNWFQASFFTYEEPYYLKERGLNPLISNFEEKSNGDTHITILGTYQNREYKITDQYIGFSNNTLKTDFDDTRVELKEGILFEDDVIIEFVDTNKNQLIDKSDEINVYNCLYNNTYEIIITGTCFHKLVWISGVGLRTGVIPHIVLSSLYPQNGNQTVEIINVIGRVGDPIDLYKITLELEEEEIFDMDLLYENKINNSYYIENNGIKIFLVDADNNERLTKGDLFLFQGLKTNSDYNLKLKLLRYWAPGMYPIVGERLIYT